MEVEQRIGRIDRFGQQNDKIYVLNFHTPGTIETDIISRVHSRIGVFAASIGELEPILRSELPRIQQAMLDFRLSPAERDRRLDEALAALEHKSMIRAEIEDAANALNVLDDAVVDGFADDVIRSGRYVGQPELVWLLEDWAATAPGAACRRTDEGADRCGSTSAATPNSRRTCSACRRKANARRQRSRRCALSFRTRWTFCCASIRRQLDAKGPTCSMPITRSCVPRCAHLTAGRPGSARSG